MGQRASSISGCPFLLARSPRYAMNCSLVAPTVVQRTGLFSVVVGAHLVLLTMLTLAKVTLPVSEERVIAVELLPMGGGGPAARSPRTGRGHAVRRAGPVVCPVAGCAASAAACCCTACLAGSGGEGRYRANGRANPWK